MCNTHSLVFQLKYLKKCIFLFDNEKLRQGTVSVISSDPPCKDVNARFTTVSLKPLSDQQY